MDVLKILFVFALTIIFLGRRFSINIVIPAASILLGLLFGVAPLEFLRAYGLSAISETTLQFVLTMYLIMLLEELMGKQGYMERMLDSLDGLFHSKRLNISLLPMLIGFLPSAGGALFSAPMVAKATEGTSLTPEDKTFLNTLYRHIMELFFPTYPCIILASKLSGLPFYRLVSALFPMAIFVYLIGMWHLRKLPRLNAPIHSAGRGHLARVLLLSLWPLIALIALILVVHLEVYTATAIVLVALLLVERLPLASLPKLIKEATHLRVLVMVVVVMAFKDILVLCGVMEIMPAAINQLPIPTFLLYSLMTLIIAAITGLTLAPMAITLPLALVGVSDPLPTTMLLMLSGYCGVMITPLHLCITLVSEYFNANLRRVLLKSLPPYFAVYAVSIGIFLLLNR